MFDSLALPVRNFNSRKKGYMDRPICLMVFGYSGAGKDTLSNIFVERGYKRMHPIYDFKVFLAELCDYNVADLDSPKRFELANKIGLIDKDILYAKCQEFSKAHYEYADPAIFTESYKESLGAQIYDALVSFIHAENLGVLMQETFFLFNRFDKEFSLAYIHKFFAEHEQNTVCVALRNKHEVEFITQDWFKAKYNCYLVWVDRPECHGLETDCYQKTLFDYTNRHIKISNVAILRNNGTLREWTMTCNQLYEKIDAGLPIIDYHSCIPI